MEVTAEIKSFQCPKCGVSIEPAPDAGPDTACPSCRWKGTAHLFKPVLPLFYGAQAAMQNDAVCAHHPAKRAVAICEGTGSYICELCLVELNGKKYSVQFLEGKGRQLLDETCYRYFERPDYEIAMYFGVGFFAMMTFVLSPLALVVAPIGIFKYVQLIKLRKSKPIMKDIVGTTRLVLYGIFIVLVTIAFAAMAFSAIARFFMGGW